MTSKRMTSVSVSDLHDSVSNLSINGIDSSTKIPKNFDAKYLKLDEIGRGGFSYVYKCKDRVTEIIYAVKIIDLRPLRLRDNFDSNRLRREVDIMKNLRHTNIVQFIEYFETPDEFYMVLEYCPGRELFDVILEKQSLSETEARPIFYQITSAVSYLHGQNIMHRDIKPENILVLSDPDPNTGLSRVKLLDFGLSKDAGNGSAGKSFVGTPCYLAPEVEYTSHGRGGVYGLAADCWSLGAVLHVMLVARFPEFERDRKGQITLILPNKYWHNISVQAKDLVKCLMEPNAFTRMTVKEALEHSWFGPYRSTFRLVPRTSFSSLPIPQMMISNDNSKLSLHDEINESANPLNHPIIINSTTTTTTGMNINTDTHTSVVVKTRSPGANSGGNTPTTTETMADSSLSLGPLLNLQRSIALCFEDALSSYTEYPEVATQIHRGAVMCRKQLMDSTKMLRKVEQTASSVLELFPDLELAVEEAAPQLAAEFFSVVRGWVVELRDTVTTTQLANHESMMQIHAIIQESTVGLNRREKSNINLAEVIKSHLDQNAVLTNIKKMQSLVERSGNGSLTTEQIFELFMSLFNSTVEETLDGQDNSGEEGMTVEEPGTPANENGELSASNSFDTESVKKDERMLMSDTERTIFESTSYNQVAVLGSDSSNKHSPSAAKLLEALHKLRQVDLILEQLGVFWANTEVVLDVLAKKGQHAEQFVAFANKPRLLARFKERLAEYSKFWIGVRDMCSTYVSNVQPQAETKIRLYEFLEKESSKDVSTMSDQLYGSTLMNRGGSNTTTISPAYVNSIHSSPERVPSMERFDKVESI